MLDERLREKSIEFKDVIKIGRTHLQDATPVTLGQEFGGYSAMLKAGEEQIIESLENLRFLAQGGTAVGTGLNAPPEFSRQIAEEISLFTRTKFYPARNFFQALSSHDAISFFHGALRTLAGSLMKIANDIRWLSSGPRSGIGELKIPENEPGSSIMPGKVNPSQAEALTMIAVQIMGNDAAISIAASQGNFELNTYKPLIAYNLMQSLHLLADGMNSFEKKCVSGIQPRKNNIDRNLKNSLMLVTALTPEIGYDRAADIAKLAYERNWTLKQATMELGYMSEDDFDRIMDPGNMI
jgi:fumarate hydratase class II